MKSLDFGRCALAGCRCCDNAGGVRWIAALDRHARRDAAEPRNRHARRSRRIVDVAGSQ